MGYTIQDLQSRGIWDGLDEPMKQRLLAQEQPVAQPVVSQPPDVTARVIGEFQAGMGETVGKVGRFANLLGTFSPSHTAERQAFREQVVKQGEQFYKDLPAVKAVTEHPPESLPGQIASGLVRFAPQLPLYGLAGAAVGPVAGLGLRAAQLPGAASWLTGTGGNIVSSTLRAATRGAMEGAAVGAVTAEPDKRFETALEEAEGFALAAPAFHLAGKAIGYGLKKGLGKLTAMEESAKADLPQVGQLRGVKSFEEAPASWEFKQTGDVVDRWGNWKAAKARLDTLVSTGEGEGLFVVKDKTKGDYLIAKEVAKHPIATPEDIKAGVEASDMHRPEEVSVGKDGVPVRKASEADLVRPKSPGEMTFDEFKAQKEALQRPEYQGPFASPVDKFESELYSATGDVQQAKSFTAISEAYRKALGETPENFYGKQLWRGYEADIKLADGGTVQGRMFVEDGKAIVELYKSADASTVIHDGWHVFERLLPPELKTRMADIVMKDPEALAAFETFRKTGRPEKEFMAHSFEEWLRTGESPVKNREVVGAFKKFKQWLIDIYTGMKAVNGVGVSAEMDQFFKDVFKVTPEQLKATRVENLKRAVAAKKAKANSVQNQDYFYHATNDPSLITGRELAVTTTEKAGESWQNARKNKFLVRIKAKGVTVNEGTYESTNKIVGYQSENIEVKTADGWKSLAKLSAEERVARAKAGPRAVKEVMAEEPVEVSRMSPEEAYSTVTALNKLGAEAKKYQAAGNDIAEREFRQSIQEMVEAAKQQYGLEPAELVKLASEHEAALARGEKPTGTQKDIDHFGEGKQDLTTVKDFEAEGQMEAYRPVYGKTHPAIPESAELDGPVPFSLVRAEKDGVVLRFEREGKDVDVKMSKSEFQEYFERDELYQTVFHGGPENLAAKGIKPLTEAERKGTGGAMEGAGFYVTEQHKAGEYYALGAKQSRLTYQSVKAAITNYFTGSKLAELKSSEITTLSDRYSGINKAAYVLKDVSDPAVAVNRLEMATDIVKDKYSPGEKWNREDLFSVELFQNLIATKDYEKFIKSSSEAYLHKINLPTEKMNWLEWDKPVDFGILRAASEFMKAETGQSRASFSPEDYLTGKQFYSKLVEFFGTGTSAKEHASQFLADNGIDGMKYRGQSASGERYKGDYFNYVVYDPAKWLKPESFEMTGLYQKKPLVDKLSPEWNDYVRSIEKAIMEKQPVTMETLRKTQEFSDTIKQTYEDKLAFQRQGLKTEFEKLSKAEAAEARRMEEYGDSGKAQEQYRVMKLVADKVKNLTPEDKNQVNDLLKKVDVMSPLSERLSNAASMHPEDFAKAVNVGELRKLVGADERLSTSELMANLKLSMDAFKQVIRDSPKDLLENPAKSAAMFDKFSTLFEKMSEWDERIESAQMGWMYDPKMQSRRWLKGAWAVAADDMFSNNNPRVFKALTAIHGMHWMAKKFPVLEPLYELHWKRLESATMLAGDIMQGSANMGYEWKGKRYELDGFRPLTMLIDNDPAAYKWVSDLLLVGDAMKKRFTPTELETLVQKSFGQRRYDIIAAYDSVRNTQDWIFYKTLQHLTEGVDNPAKLAKLEKELSERMNYHEGYIPHTREGKWTLAVFKDSKSTDTVHMEQMQSHIDATRRLAQLKEEYPGHTAKLVSTKEAIRMGVTAKQELVSLLDDLASKTQTPEAVADSMREAALQMLKEKGYWTHYKARKDVPGYDRRVGRVLHQQAMEYAGFISKMDFAKDAWGELSSLRTGGYNQLHNYSRDWLDGMLKNSDATDQFFSRIRSAMFVKYLGANVKSSIMAVMEKVTNVPYFLSFYSDKPHQMNAAATKDIVAWTKWKRDAARFVEENRKTDHTYSWRQALGTETRPGDFPLPAGISQKEAIALYDLYHKGSTRAQYTQLMASQLSAAYEFKQPSEPGRVEFGKAQEFLDKTGAQVMKYSTWLISNMEQMGRESTALAAFRIFQEKGYDVAKSGRMAERLVYDAHFMHGKANQPLWLNKGGVNQLAKLALVFRSQEWNYLSMLGHLTGIPGTKGKLAAAKSLLTIAGLGGAMTMPLFPAANKLITAATGKDPAETVKNKLNSMTDGEYLGELFGAGLPSLLGIDISGSMRVGGDTTMMGLATGVAGATVNDMIAGAQAASHGDFMTTAERWLPMVASNPIKAVERMKYGVTTARGNPVTMAPGEPILKLSGYEALGHMIGFQPSTLTRAYEKEAVRLRSDSYWQAKRSSIYTMLKKGTARGDEKTIDRAFERISEFNQSIPNSISPITAQTIKQSLSDRPSRRKLMQEEELFGD